MPLPITKEGHNYTYEDYLTWPEGERWELIDGIAYAKTEGQPFRPDQPMSMSPAPSRRHQQVAGELFFQIKRYLKAKPCQVYMAPFDVRLSEPNTTQIRHSLQPDIAVVCDTSKLDEKGCLGAPDWIIEVVSPSSGAMDYVKKLHLYECYGVREYWIVHPFDETLFVFKLGENALYGRPDSYTSEAEVPVGIFNGALVLGLADIFAE